MRRRQVSQLALPADDFLRSMAQAGLPLSDYPLADGEIHRFHVEGDRRGSVNGWYVLFPGCLYGAFGSWKTGVTVRWRHDRLNTLPRSERRALARRIERARQIRQQEQTRREHRAAEIARFLWNKASPAMPSHPYLTTKRILPHGIRQSGRMLFIPARDSVGKLCSLQCIQPKGRKRFLSGGRIAGCYHAMGSMQDCRLTSSAESVLLICEGYATGASLLEHTGYPVAAAFSAGNLLPVARVLRGKYPSARLVLCADNDQWTDGNPGLTKAREAALAVNGVVAVPEFPVNNGSAGEHDEPRYTDFNDLANLSR